MFRCALSVSLLGALGLLASSCGPLRCDAAYDCPAPANACVNHSCVRLGCDTAADCAGGDRCVESACVPSVTSCVRDSDCPSSTFCYGSPWPACTSSGGFCGEDGRCR